MCLVTNEMRFFTLMATFLTASWTPQAREICRDSYDFIIVGAGSAGSVLANRLTENSKLQVLLLEAGHDAGLFSLIPIAAPFLQFTNKNWHYTCEVQSNMSQGLIDNRQRWPRGKALGGSSAINYMIYARGSKADYDRWAASGSPGWSYQDVLPYFKKSENANKLENADYEFHGTGGNLNVEDTYQSPLGQAFVDGSQELGLPHVDYNAVRSVGIGRVQATQIRGTRDSVARAYLKPVQRRENLHILKLAFVTKVLIDPEQKEAYGVEYERFGIKHFACANNEVILSAGAFNSPQILMLSGLGPKEHLTQLGIPVIKDLAVGENLHEHYGYPSLTFSINETLSFNILKIFSPKSLLEFLFLGKGPVTSLVSIEGIGYIKTNISKDLPSDLPDIEWQFQGGCVYSDHGLIMRRSLNINKDVYDSMFGSVQNKSCWSICPILIQPKSRGYMRLRSTNPHDHPLLYGNFFTDAGDEDINTMVEAVRQIQRLSMTKSFKKYDSKIVPNLVPSCDREVPDSDDYWKCAIKAVGTVTYQPAGTVKMGRDSASVVDNKLKVYGISRLRVVDCSVIPVPVGAHYNAVGVMIGEKASDIIKKEWNFA